MFGLRYRVYRTEAVETQWTRCLATTSACRVARGTFESQERLWQGHTDRISD